MIPHYIQQGYKKRLFYCLGIAPLAGLEMLPNDISMGDTVLQKYFVEYDRENSRVGFAIAKPCVEPTAVAPGQEATAGENGDGERDANSANGDDGSWWSAISKVPKLFWYIIIVGLLILCVSRPRRTGYQPIDSKN